MNIRMIGFDLDGTLLDNGQDSDGENEESIGGSGRSGSDSGTGDGTAIMWTSKGTSGASVYKYAVTANGARILETKTEQVLSEMLISVEKGRNIGYFLRL